MAEEPVGTLGPAIMEALKKGNKIEAIKLLRQASGLGLAEAKQLLDRYEAAKLKTETAARTVAAPHAAGPSHVYHPRPGLSPGQVAPSSGASAAAVVVALIAAAAGAYFLLH
jgi:hypothetical protein